MRYTQAYEIYYNETFVPIAKISFVWVFISNCKFWLFLIPICNEKHILTRKIV